jgi:hypothetical protein
MRWLNTSLDLIYPPISDLSEVMARVTLPLSEWLGVRINDLQASLSDSPQKLFSRNRSYLTKKGRESTSLLNRCSRRWGLG